MRALLAIAICACRSSAPPAPAPSPSPSPGPPPVAVVIADAAAPVAPQRFAISAGNAHVCARTRDGHVACWGALGDVSSVAFGSRFFPDQNPVRPTLVPNLDHVVGVLAGADQHCAWTDRGAAWCWGVVGTQDSDVRAPKAIAGLTDVIQLSGGVIARMMCALKKDGHVACWGDQKWSEHGETERGDALLAPAEIRPVPEIQDAVEIAVGFDHACARLAIGTVVCWNGPTPAHVLPIGGAAGAISLSGGGNGGGASSFIALLPGGHAVHWYMPGHTAELEPAVLPADATAITLGSEACVIGSAITCWNLRSVATHAIAIDHPLEVSAGGGVSCASSADGRAWCWGSRGFLGDGRGTQAFDAIDLPLTDVTSIAIDQHTTCAVAGGHVYCWGTRLAYIRKDDLDYPEDPAPVEMPGITDAVEVAIDNGGACARLASKRTLCWGNNGRPTKSGIWTMPTNVPALGGGLPFTDGLCTARACMAGGTHGRGGASQLDRLISLPSVQHVYGGGFARESWTCVSTAKDVQCLHLHYGKEGTDVWPEMGFEMHAGGREVISTPPGAGWCMRMADGSVSCADVGSREQVVPGVADAIALGHGPNYGVCALIKDGTVLCWPEEMRAAKLGPDPAHVGNATNAIALASGPDHACILRRDGHVACWGAWSLIGTSEPAATDVPQVVPGLSL